jgi:hypothetical protein
VADPKSGDLEEVISHFEHEQDIRDLKEMGHEVSWLVRWLPRRLHRWLMIKKQ